VHAISVAAGDGEVSDLRAGSAGALGTGADDPRVHVEVGHRPAAAIRARAGELGSCLVCMSTHGRTGLAGALLGSVASEVFEHLAGPVVVVGPAVRPARGPAGADALAAGSVVACVDGTAASEGIVPVAAAWADALGAACTVVTVAEPVPAPTRVDAPWGRRHGPDRDVDAYLAELRERWATAAPGLRTAPIYDPIGPGPGVETYLRDHPTALVAVASYPRTGLGSFRLGSGAGAIVKAATTPVLVVPVAQGSGDR
jgi:nucleotide-binding universal stress UspA family protein